MCLRDRLRPVLDTFTAVQMWTLTINPTLFESPQEAYDYVRSRRCVAKLVGHLNLRGHLHTPRYFCVVEWQANTSMPHFHLLLDATYVPFDVARREWGRFRPPIPPATAAMWGNRPALGGVHFSQLPREKSTAAQEALGSVCAYLTKIPSHGYPNWVLDSPGQIHRYSTSHGFWKSVQANQGFAAPRAYASSTSVGTPPASTQPVKLPPLNQRPAGSRTIRQRVAGCGQRGVVLRVIPDVAPTGQVIERREFFAALPCGFPKFAAHLGWPAAAGNGAFRINAAQWFAAKAALHPPSAATSPTRGSGHSTGGCTTATRPALAATGAAE